MSVCFWYLVKRDLSSVHVYSSLHWTNPALQGTRATRLCLSGRVVAAKIPTNFKHDFKNVMPDYSFNFVYNLFIS